MSDPRDALARVEAMKAVSAEEQKRRRERVTDTRDALLRAAEAQLARAKAARESANPQPIFDPWENLLRGLEKRAGIFRMFDANGDVELRIRTRYILTNILCICPAHFNGQTQGVRLGRVMRKLGWRGPMDLRFGKLKGKGYAKTKVSGSAILTAD